MKKILQRKENIREGQDQKKEREQEIQINVTSWKLLASLVILLLWILSLGITWFWSAGETKSKADKLYPLINPRLRNLSQEERASKAFVTLVPLRDELFTFLGDEKNDVAFYVEDLNTGAWSGWQERTNFIPASLVKVPISIGVMKKIDQNQWALDTELNIKPEYKNKHFGTLWKEEDNNPIAVRELLEQMLSYSDNTATNVLFNNLSREEREAVYYHIGISNIEANTDNKSELLFNDLTPRNLASMFRALYNATYLTRESSNYLLQILTDTKFDSLIPTKIPPGILVAHKMASLNDTSLSQLKVYHDCGIVFYPGHPYLFCVLTRNQEKDSSIKVITGAGGIIYDYFKKGGKK